MMRGLTALTTAIVAMWAVVPVQAADLPARTSGVPFQPANPNAWTVTVGIDAAAAPRYEGSDEFVFRPTPIIDVRRAGTPPRFHSPREGFGVGILDFGSFRAGPVGKLRYPRKEGDTSDLRGLGDVDWAVEVGGFAEFWPTQWLRAYAEVRQGFGGHKGVVSDILIDAVYHATPQLTLSAGPRLTLQSSGAVSPYFDVTAAQSAASGLPVYDAGGGVTSWGVGGQARYQWSPQWATYTYVEYQRLVGDVADSPLVSLRGTRDQVQVGLGVSYSFDVPALW
jgi:outer membrane protein